MKGLLGFIGVAMVIAGLGYMLYRNSLWEEYDPLDQRRWLEHLFRGKGYTVVWEENDSIDKTQFGLMKPETQTEEFYKQNFARLRSSSFIKFFERKEGDIFFVFGDRIYSFSLDHGEHNAVSSLFTPSDARFRLRGGGQFSPSSQKDLERLFPYDEVKALRTRALYPLAISWGISGVLIVWCGYRALRFGLRQVVLDKQVTVLPTPKESSLTIATSLLPGPSPPYAKPFLKELSILREGVLAVLNQLIEVYDEGEIRATLVAVRQEAQRENRIAKLRYILTDRIPAILERRGDIELVETGRIESLPPKSQIVEEKDWHLELSVADQWIPQDISGECVKAILLELLGIGGKPPFFGLHRCRYEMLQRWITSRGFAVKEWKDAFEWLRKKGILLYDNPHCTGPSCSLNPKKQETSPPGDEIVGLLVAMRRQIKKGDLNR